MKKWIGLLAFIVSYSCSTFAADQDDTNDKQNNLDAKALQKAFDECLLDQLHSAEDDMSVAKIREYCGKKYDLSIFKKSKELLPNEDNKSKSLDSRDSQVTKIKTEKQSDDKQDSDLVKTRLRQEYRARNNRFAILPHKPNYLLPLTFNNNPNQDGLGSDKEVDNIEVKFQVSFKTPIWEQPFGKNSALFFAYTGQSYWQAYNSDVSSPFRETNHQPEIFASWATDWKVGGWQVPVFSLGIEHQSNGQSDLNSRSWNRIYTEWVLERDRWVVAFRPWWRIPEDEKETPDDPQGDDNPDIDDYMGYFELQTRYRWDEHNFGIMLRNNLRSDNKGAVQLDWTFPFDDKGKLRGYIQYFNGYGESLIDYNKSTSRLGIGFVLTDWL